MVEIKDEICKQNFHKKVIHWKRLGNIQKWKVAYKLEKYYATKSRTACKLSRIWYM